MATTFERIRSIVAEELAVTEGQVTPDMALSADFGADSLTVAQIVMKVEEEFGIEIDEIDAERIATVGQMVDYVDAKCGTAGSGARAI